MDARRVLVYTTEFLPLAWVEQNRERHTLLVQSPSDYLKQFFFYEYVREREEWSASIGRTSTWEDTNPWVGALAARLTKLPYYVHGCLHCTHDVEQNMDRHQPHEGERLDP